jgi:hypothetical protein
LIPKALLLLLGSSFFFCFAGLALCLFQMFAL